MTTVAIVAISAFTVLVVAFTVVPLIPIAHGFVRVCEFPRLQIVVLTLVLAVLTLLFVPMPDGGLLLAFQAAVVVTQGRICLRYTPLWRVQSLPFAGSGDGPSTFDVVSANVKMSNTDHDPLVALVRETAPDMVIFLEVDHQWMAALAPLRADYPFRVETPLDNSYGMVLWSRLELAATEVRHLLLPEVPSIHTEVVLGDGRRFRLHVLHPEPPVPFADTLGRDGELILTAREVTDDPMPAVVAGDLNDVAWSHTTRRFQRLSGLLDPRVGRGFFNSFDARHWWLRWPLDHLFHAPEFRLVRLERLPDIGSDHFPMLFELALTEEEGAGETPDAAHSADHAEADEVVREARDLDRRPIGTDWEK